MGSCKSAMELWRKKETVVLRTVLRQRWREYHAFHSTDIKPDKVLLRNNEFTLLHQRQNSRECTVRPWSHSQFMRNYCANTRTPSLVRSISSQAPKEPRKKANETKKDISTVEDPFDSPTYNIPEKPLSFTEGSSYSLLIIAGLGVTAASAYAVSKEFIFEPKEYNIFGKALKRVQDDVEVLSHVANKMMMWLFGFCHMEKGILASSPSSSSSSSSLPSPVILTQDELKKIAAYKAVEYVESGMVLGLGTGSTAKHAVARIGELLHQGKLKNIVGIPTSKMTHEQAVSVGIPLSDLDSHPVLDLAIDGADEVDPYLNLVKGRGGSLLREKMVEGACKKFIVIVDETKMVKHLGGSGLAMPVEIIPFCWKFTAQRLQNLFEDAGCVAKLRTFGEKVEPFVTDNGNYIVDLYFKKDIGDLKVASDSILRLAGVVEHGMFLDMATTVIIAGELGVTLKNK
ncbi:probable ribose-5-phosphate isomerase 2 isoform X2 [Cannabis sativa]|uniref:probable ribose-5-phosphate isomerase 2 isoform X2 n=1 Tax=Cannabis sativa TaxID=3483 RepID=UPI0029CA0AA6|nr:probable ribose-5-phosphate isomerase 2 isoform X2 [Cannabis sativa]